MKINRLISKSDIFIVLIVIIMALMGIIWVYSAYTSNVDAEVIITVNSEIFKETSLKSDKGQVIKINDTNTVVIENGYVYMQSANCNDKLCIKQGKITKIGESIVCLPNKIVVEIKERAAL